MKNRINTTTEYLRANVPQEDKSNTKERLLSICPLYYEDYLTRLEEHLKGLKGTRRTHAQAIAESRAETHRRKGYKFTRHSVTTTPTIKRLSAYGNGYGTAPHHEDNPLEVEHLKGDYSINRKHLASIPSWYKPTPTPTAHGIDIDGLHRLFCSCIRYFVRGYEMRGTATDKLLRYTKLCWLPISEQPQILQSMFEEMCINLYKGLLCGLAEPKAVRKGEVKPDEINRAYADYIIKVLSCNYRTAEELHNALYGINFKMLYKWCINGVAKGHRADFVPTAQAESNVLEVTTYTTTTADINAVELKIELLQLLTDKQKQVFELFLKGYTEREIASRLDKAQPVVHRQIKAITKKLEEALKNI